MDKGTRNILLLALVGGGVIYFMTSTNKSKEKASNKKDKEKQKIADKVEGMPEDKAKKTINDAGLDAFVNSREGGPSKLATMRVTPEWSKNKIILDVSEGMVKEARPA